MNQEEQIVEGAVSQQDEFLPVLKEYLEGEESQLTPSENFIAALEDDSDCYEYDLKGFSEDELALIYSAWSFRGLYYPRKIGQSTMTSRVLKDEDREMAYRMLSACEHMVTLANEMKERLASKFKVDDKFREWYSGKREDVSDLSFKVREFFQCPSEDQLCQMVVHVDQDSIFYRIGSDDIPKMSKMNGENKLEMYTMVKEHFAKYHGIMPNTKGSKSENVFSLEV